MTNSRGSGSETLLAGRLWRFQEAALDEAALRLTVAGEAVPLERRPLEMLLLLLRHAGEVLSKDEIMAALWPDRIVGEASLTKCAARLRQALGESASAIRTVHGYGYRLDGPVQVAERPGAPLQAAVALEPGDAVPHRPGWLLARRIGTGGFGDVWLAEQEGGGAWRAYKFAADAPRLAALRREIALSRLLRAALGPREDLAHVLDWELGETPGFAATAWSAQGNLAQWLEAQGGARAVPLATRLAIAADIAAALAAAHGAGVLHRDLKPSNVLMREAPGGPGIRLADFGSGGLTDPARLAAFGITGLEEDLGTAVGGASLPYRAPELLAGRPATPRSDVYALGVLLFQLVTGDLAASPAPGWDNAVTDPLLREDIAATAAGDPAARILDAAALAERLRSLPARRAARLRAAEQAEAQARLEASLARARARRGPVLALIGVLAVALVVTAGLAWRANAARQVALRESARAETISAFVTHDLLSAANPELADPNVTVRQILNAAAAALPQRFAAGTLDRAAIETTIGTAYAALTDKRARPLLLAALETRRRILGDADPATQETRLALAAMEDALEDNQAAIGYAREVLRSGGAGLPAETSLRARALVATNACNANPVEAKCVAPVRALYEEARRTLGAQNDVTLTLEINLAFNLSQAEQFPDAISLARDAVSLAAARAGSNSPATQQPRYALAQVLMEAGQAGEAITLLQGVLHDELQEAGRENGVTIRTRNQLGKAYYQAKRYAEALPYFVQAAAFYDAAGENGTHKAIAAQNNRAAVLEHLGRFAEAIPVQQAVLTAVRAQAGPDNANTLWCENALARMQDAAGDPAAAAATNADLLPRARRAFGGGDWDLGQFLAQAGQADAHLGRREAARAELQEAVDILTRKLGAQHMRTVAARQALAALH